MIGYVYIYITYKGPFFNLAKGPEKHRAGPTRSFQLPGLGRPPVQAQVWPSAHPSIPTLKSWSVNGD